jgi:hypothetical protein
MQSVLGETFISQGCWSPRSPDQTVFFFYLFTAYEVKSVFPKNFGHLGLWISSCDIYIYFFYFTLLIKITQGPLDR